MQSCVEVPFLPSDVDRLILGYLSDSKYTDTYKCLLRESPFLHEYTYLLNLGVVCPTTTCDGHSLLDILSDFFGQKRRQKQQLGKRLAHGRLSQVREQMLQTSSQLLPTSSPAPASATAPVLNSTAAVVVQISAAQLRQLQQQQQQQVLQVQSENPEQQQQVLQVQSEHPEQHQQVLQVQSEHPEQHQQVLQVQSEHPEQHQQVLQLQSEQQQQQQKQQVFKPAEFPQSLTQPMESIQAGQLFPSQHQLHLQQPQQQQQEQDQFPSTLAKPALPMHNIPILQHDDGPPVADAADQLEDMEMAEEADVCVAASASSSASTEPPGCSSASHYQLDAQGHKKKRRPRKELLAASVVALPLLAKPSEEKKKLIDRILSSPDKFTNSWEQAVNSRKLDTDTEKLKQLLDSEQQANQRDELADLFLAAIFDDSLPPQAQQHPPSLPCSTIVEVAGLPSSHVMPDFADNQMILANQDVEARLLHIREEGDSTRGDEEVDESEEANIVCDSMHIESIMTELNSPFRRKCDVAFKNPLPPQQSPSSARRQIIFPTNSALEEPIEPPSAIAKHDHDAAAAAASLTLGGRDGQRQADQLLNFIPSSSYWAGINCDLDESFCSSPNMPPLPSAEHQQHAEDPDPSADPTPTAPATPSTPPTAEPLTTSPSPPPPPTQPLSSAVQRTSIRKRYRSSSRLTAQQQQQPPSPAPSPHSHMPAPRTSGPKRAALTTSHTSGFVCTLCHHSYSSRGRLDRHLQVHQEISRASADAAAAKKQQQRVGAGGSRGGQGAGNALSRRVRTDLKAMDINSFINSIAARK